MAEIIWKFNPETNEVETEVKERTEENINDEAVAFAVFELLNGWRSTSM